MGANKREWRWGISKQSLPTADLRFESNSCELASISGLFGCHKINSSLFLSGERRQMKFLSIIAASLVVFLGGFASPSVGQESRWGSPGEETVKFMIAAEAKWANSACSPQPDLKDVIADDFRGTA